jgi:hypothetical protein
LEQDTSQDNPQIFSLSPCYISIDETFAAQLGSSAKSSLPAKVQISGFSPADFTSYHTFLSLHLIISIISIISSPATRYHHPYSYHLLSINLVCIGIIIFETRKSSLSASIGDLVDLTASRDA